MDIEPPAGSSHADGCPEKPIGMYAELGNDTVGLFVLRGEMFLWWNGHSYAIPTDRQTQHTAEDQSRRLRVTLGGQRFTAEYTADAPVTTQFYSEDDEDADFGLWLHNVLSSDERTKLIRQLWKDGIA